ncbi:MAG: dynamin family protein [Acidimicrobiia bacterium]
MTAPTAPDRPLLERVRTLIHDARTSYASDLGTSGVLRALASRLDEPLRVALAGRVKSGKSTLLNALVGEPLAAADTGECTRFVTWYRHGVVYRTLVQPRGGEPLSVPFRRAADRIEPSLDGFDPDGIERLVVEWPSPVLASTTFIDTPGLGSLTASLGERTTGFLVPERAISPADAVVYLTRHFHAHDVRFLEAFRDDDAGRPDPINAVAVLARADEVGAGRIEAMETAERVAERYRRDPQVRRLCQTVVPVAGLLALGAALLSEDDFGAFRRLAAADAQAIEAVIVSTDRFGGREIDVGVPLEVRARLLDRYGIFGVRLARELVRTGAVHSARELALELRRRSGIERLGDVLASQFAARAGVLKARGALAALGHLLRTSPPPDGGGLAARLEEVAAGAHELAEHRVLLALRVGALDLRDDETAEIEELFERAGTRPAARLGLEDHADRAVVTEEIVTRVKRWHRRAEHPLAPPLTVDAARVLARSYEGMLLELE